MNVQYIYTMKNLGKVFPPNHHVLKGIWLSFLPGAKNGVLGLNGAGKSTLLKIMAGLDTDFTGEAFPADGIRVGYLPQEPQLDATKTVLENIQEGVTEITALLQEFDQINQAFANDMSPEKMDDLLARQARIQDAIEARNGWDLDSRLEMAMDALRCPPGDSAVSHLSGGEKRRVALCRLLLQAPDLLLLDEPTNHLDAETTAWLEHYLADYPGTVVAITHDRYFLDNVAGWILELDRGEGIPWKGNYSSWLEQKQARLDREAKQEQARQKALALELEWIRMTPKARQTKNKARIQAYESRLSQAPTENRHVGAIFIPPGPRLGDQVVEAHQLAKAYDGRLLFDQLDFQLPPGGIVGVVGPNGSGKTTLLRLITQRERPDAGDLKIGDTVQIAHVDQSRDELNPEHTVWEAVSEGRDVLQLGHREVNSRAYLAAFNIKGQDQQKKISQMSGGERNRVHLARLVKSGGNLLLLDEPTNDLDVETLRSLETALEDFPGCAVVVSHDRWFLDRIATHILAFEGDSQVVWFEGNYDAYEEDRKRRLGEAAAQPHRIKYRRFSRD